MLRELAHRAAIAVAGLTIASGGAWAGTGDTSAVAPANPAVENVMTPKDAGARYGQALGATEICIGSTITSKAKSLGDAFKDADLEDYKKQAAKIYDAWLKVRDCRRELDPNQCKIIMDKSCEAAEAEIGSSGKIVPGLVEFLKR